MAKSNKVRYGIFYKSHGKWTGPYAGMTFTKYTWSRKPATTDLNILKNRILKSRVKLAPVKA